MPTSICHPLRCPFLHQPAQWAITLGYLALLLSCRLSRHSYSPGQHTHAQDKLSVFLLHGMSEALIVGVERFFRFFVSQTMGTQGGHGPVFSTVGVADDPIRMLDILVGEW
eukprot:scaffold39359_cov28-Tisochrysis_lutea.AAC.1